MFSKRPQIQGTILYESHLCMKKARFIPSVPCYQFCCKTKMPLVRYMIFLHTADMPRLFSNNKLLSLMVIKFTPLFAAFLTLKYKESVLWWKRPAPQCSQRRDFTGAHYHFVWCHLPIAVLPWCRNHSLMLPVLERSCFFSLHPLPTPHLLAW